MRIIASAEGAESARAPRRCPPSPRRGDVRQRVCFFSKFVLAGKTCSPPHTQRPTAPRVRPSSACAPPSPLSPGRTRTVPSALTRKHRATLADSRVTQTRTHAHMPRSHTHTATPPCAPFYSPPPVVRWDSLGGRHHCPLHPMRARPRLRRRSLYSRLMRRVSVHLFTPTQRHLVLPDGFCTSSGDGDPHH